ncbi:MAG: SdpI family protein [Firmicutes bacterium]|nr:SdpI family protein [Bacillota bacterium]
MNLNSLMAIFSDFDLAAFLPELNTLLGWVETLLRLAVMAGPLLLLLFGLIYLLKPPAEANYALGYRFWWSMASLDAWRFTHRLAGYVWSGLGLLLTVIMALICNGFRRMDPMTMVWAAAKCLGWELALTLIACLAIDITVVAVFDRSGFRRNENG